ncbi:MAG TPA: hypothetical protein VL988_06600 [Solirubrobacteraceae bacterium]|nr:hypothetical protein [Solirubrobacteraceae bacterium]
MPRTHGNRHARPTAAAALLIVLAALGLAACGGSTKGSSTATNASATGPNGKRGGQFAARATALRACLQKEGITLPKRPSGQGGGSSGTGGAPGGGGYGGPYGAPYGGQPPAGAGGGRGPFGDRAGGGPQLPKGVTRAQFEAALKKCGSGAFRRGGRGFDTAAGRQRFAKFAECMRKNGVKLPSPNTSGNGPIFNTKGIDTNSAAFKAADAKCQKELRPSGGTGGTGGGAAPVPGGGAAPVPGGGPSPGGGEVPPTAGQGAPPEGPAPGA